MQFEDDYMLVKAIIASELVREMLVDWGCLENQHLKDLKDEVGVIDLATVMRCFSVKDVLLLVRCVQATRQVVASSTKR